MSAVAAIVHLDGSPVDEAMVRALTRALSVRGPDASGVWTSGWAGLGHCLMRTLPEDVAQPVVGPGRSCAIAFDGRIDNRQEIARAAGIASCDRMSDAELLLAGYAAWGDAIFARVLGDFAFALWDQARRRFVAARDVFGLKPLYYRVTDRQLMMASALRAIQQVSPAHIDDGMVGEALTGWLTSPTGTLYRGVSRLQPGYCLIADTAGVRTRQFSSITAMETRARAKPADYAEEFHALFADAVTARLRSPNPVGVMLSGGVDSSSVYAAASAILRRGDRTAEAFTVSHEGDYDESSHARATVTMTGGRHHVVRSSAAAFDYAADAGEHLDTPIHPAGANGWACRRYAAMRGVNVLLSGVGADEWFGGHRWHQTDLLVAGRWRSLWRVWQRERGIEDRFSTRDFVLQTLMPLLPRPVKAIGRRLTGVGGLPEWIRPDFAARINLADRMRVPTHVEGDTHARRGMLLQAINGGAFQSMEEEERLGMIAGTENRYPFFDRRIASFALSLPEPLNVGTIEPKGFLRDAFRSRLPPGAADRPCGADGAFLVLNALETLGGAAFFSRLASEEAGWIDGPGVRRSADQLWKHHRAGDDRYRMFTSPLWAVASVELWLRAVTASTVAAQQAARSA